MLSTWPSFKTSNNHLGAEKLSCLSILHCTIKKNDIKFTNEKKTVKNPLPNFSLPRTTKKTAEVSRTVSPGHCKISTSEHCFHWGMDFWISGNLAQRTRKFTTQCILFPKDALKGGNSVKNPNWISQNTYCSRDQLDSFVTSEWYYDLPLWPVTVSNWLLFLKRDMHKTSQFPMVFVR